MNRYIIIRADTKSISPPMCKQEAIKKIKEYNSQGISSYLVHKNKSIDFDCNNRLNVIK